MRKLFGVLTAFIILCILVLILTPLGLSFWLKRHYGELLGRINYSNHISVRILQFHRGWFTSDVTLQVTVWGRWIKPQPGMIITRPSEPLKFIVQQRITSGPLMLGQLDQGRRLFFGKAFVVTQSTDSNLLFTATTFIQFNNTLQNYLNAQMLIIANEREQFVVNNLKSKLTFVTRQNRLLGDTHIERFQLATKSLSDLSDPEYRPRFMVENITSHLNLQRKMLLWYGNKSVNIDKLTYLNNQNQPTEIDNILIVTHQTEAADHTTTVNTMLHATRVTAEKLNLQPINIKFSASSIDTIRLNALMATLMKSKPFLHPSLSEVRILYLPTLSLLSQGISINLQSIEAGTSDGAIQIQAHLNLPKQAETINVGSIITNAQGDFILQMPSAWFSAELANLYQLKKLPMEQSNLTPEAAAQQKIQQWLTNKKLIQDGPWLKMAITYDKGQLLINGLSPGYQAPTPPST